MSSEATALRQQSAQLRLLATRLERTALADTVAWAGPDTWRGAQVDGCADELRRCVRRLDELAIDLRRQAARLDTEANLAVARPRP
jgi:hypothetical protein